MIHEAFQGRTNISRLLNMKETKFYFISFDGEILDFQTSLQHRKQEIYTLPLSFLLFPLTPPSSQN